MTQQTTIVPPAYVTQSEELYDKAIDPQVAKGCSVSSHLIHGR